MKTLKTLLICLLTAIVMNANAQNLHFRPNGKFKIVQFTDTHIVVGNKESEKTIAMMNKVLDIETPDLVIFTGDVVTGKPVKEGFDLITAPVIARKIPYVLQYGNHDDENGLSRKELTDMLAKLPYNISQSEKLKGVDGYGNFVLEIKSTDKKSIPSIIYCMDSNAYSTNEKVKGYGWFTNNQINWYRQQSDKYTKANNGTPLPALAYFHIPLPEYRFANDTAATYTGTFTEPVCAPNINTGMFAAMVEKGDVMGTFVGHDHDNNYLVKHHGIALAYGHFSGSKTTYTNLPEGNGARVVELTEGVKAFSTWILLNNGKTIHPKHIEQNRIQDL